MANVFVRCALQEGPLSASKFKPSKGKPERVLMDGQDAVSGQVHKIQSGTEDSRFEKEDAHWSLITERDIDTDAAAADPGAAAEKVKGVKASKPMSSPGSSPLHGFKPGGGEGSVLNHEAVVEAEFDRVAGKVDTKKFEDEDAHWKRVNGGSS